VYGNGCDWIITPDTARSMASALLYFADKADEYRNTEGES